MPKPNTSYRLESLQAKEERALAEQEREEARSSPLMLARLSPQDVEELQLEVTQRCLPSLPPLTTTTTSSSSSWLHRFLYCQAGAVLLLLWQISTNRFERAVVGLIL
jgi:hypothetical protein